MNLAMGPDKREMKANLKDVDLADEIVAKTIGHAKLNEHFERRCRKSWPKHQLQQD